MINNEEEEKKVIIDNCILQPFERIPENLICDPFQTKDTFKVGN